MKHTYPKRPLKRGQCRFCPEIHSKFSDLLRHEAKHKMPKEETQPEVTREPRKQTGNVEIMQIPIEPHLEANVQMDESSDIKGAGVSGEGCLSKNFEPILADSKIKTLFNNSQMDLDAEIKERIRNYDWTKDFQKICKKGEKVVYKCKICSKSMGNWKNNTSFLYHTFVHTGEKPYQCQMCPTRFKALGARKKHEKYCGRPRKSEKGDNLDVELRERIRNYDWTTDFRKISTKEGMNAYECKICSKSMGQRRDRTKFLSHTFVHSGERPYKCQMCPKRFKARGARMRDEKHCGQTCKYENDLGLDVEIRERIRNYDWAKDFREICKKGEKVVYKCKICSKSMGQWRDRTKFLNHTFVHTGERPYQCQMCPKKYKTLEVRKRHEIIHSSKRYKCSNCSKDFTKFNHLSRHMKSHSLKMKLQKNAQDFIKNGVTRDVIICLDRVDQVKEHAHLYSQALKSISNSLPERIQEEDKAVEPGMGRILEEIGTANDMDLDEEIEIKCPELPYKCILCSERFSEPMELYNHRKIHFSNGLGPQKNVPPKNLPEILETTVMSKILNEIKSEEIEISLNPMEMQTQAIEPDESGSWTKEEISLPTPKMIFGSKLPIRSRLDLRVRKSANSGNSQMDPDAEIKERIRNYDWTKDFGKICTKNGKVAYKCKICSFRQNGLSKRNLLQHTFFHTREKPYQCSKCFKDFAYSCDLSRHMKLSCSKGNEKNKTKHFPIKNEILQENPKIPDFSAYFKLGFTQNLKISLSRVDKVEGHKNVISQARESLQSSEPEVAGGEGKNQETGKPPEKTVKTESILKKYFKKLKDGIFECLQCHHRVKNPHYHHLTHAPSKPLCNICRKEYRTQFTLNLHMKNVHFGIKIPKGNCRFCRHSFTVAYLKDHENNHRGIKRYICSICSERFTFNSNYYQHLKKHAGKNHVTTDNTTNPGHGKSNQEEILPLGVQPEIKREFEVFTEEELLDLEQAISVFN